MAVKHAAQRQLGEKDVPQEATAAADTTATRARGRSSKVPGWDLPDAEDVRQLVNTLGRGGKPIVIGPWLSEAGFELLYWIPFLAWAKVHGNLDPSQLIVISRGGAGAWYRDITSQYEDVFSFYTPDEFRVKNEARIAQQGGRLKHVEVTDFDREIVRAVTEKRGLTGARLLHPSVMYRLFDHFWFQRVPITFVEAFSSFAPLPRFDLGPLAASLPARYVVAKFYGNTALPDTPDNQRFVASTLESLTRHTDVVMLNTGFRFDDHEDMSPTARERVHAIDHLMTPANNLEVQTRVIQGAEAYIGTYGGFSYVSPLAGTDALTFYSHTSGFQIGRAHV